MHLASRVASTCNLATAKVKKKIWQTSKCTASRGVHVCTPTQLNCTPSEVYTETYEIFDLKFEC